MMNRKLPLCALFLLLATSAQAQTTWRYRCVNGMCYPEVVTSAPVSNAATAPAITAPLARPVAQAMPQPQSFSVTDIVTIVDAVMQLRRDLQAGKTNPPPTTQIPPPVTTTFPPVITTTPSPTLPTTSSGGTRDYTDDFRRVNDRLDHVSGDLANITSALQAATQQVVVIRDRVGLLESRLQQVETSLKVNPQ